MAKKGISASGQMALDLILVREGRDEVEVRGNACAAAVFPGSYKLKPMVIGGIECKKCLGKRKRDNEIAEERPVQRRRN